MLLVQPGADNRCYVELTPVTVLFPVVCHGYSVCVIVPVDIVLILEWLSVYAFTTCPISMGDIPALYHESRDNSMELTAFVVQILSTLSFSLFSSGAFPSFPPCGYSILQLLPITLVMPL